MSSRVAGPDGSAFSRGDLTVRTLLHLPTFNGASVVAGGGGLDRLVRHVTVVAGTEIARWVKPAALVVASGHLLEDLDGEALGVLIGSLDARGAACLAIRLGAYSDRVPVEIHDAADGLGFPVIMLKDAFAFDDIVIEVMSHVNESLAADLVLADNVHAALADLLISGGQLEDITREVGRLLSAQVTFVEAIAPQPGSEDAGVESPTQLTIPIGGIARSLGWLVCDRHGAAFNSAETKALERAATVAALALTQRAAVRDVEWGFRGDALGRLLRGEVTGRDVDDVFHDLDWFPRPPFYVVVISAAPLKQDRRGTLARWLRSFALDSLERGLRVKAAHAVIGLDVVLLTSATHRTDVVDAALGVAASAAVQTATGGVTPGVGLSSAATLISELPRIFGEARVAAAHGRSRLTCQVVEYDELGAIGLVLMAAGDRDVVTMANAVLGPVLRLPERDARELLCTIAALMETNLRQTEAAKLIPCHYNTLRHRVVRLESLLGPFIRDADTWVNICVAMRTRAAQAPGARSGPTPPASA